MTTCDVCHKSFASQSYLVVHHRTHTNERPFSCDICQKQFRQRGHLTDHIKLHGNKHYYGCEICGQGFKQSSGLRNHRTRCQATEVPKRRMGRPRKPKAETVGNTQESTVTNGKGSQPQTVDIDVESLHSCDICDETFSTMAKLKNHVAWHSRRKRYKCMVCSRIFKHLSIFRKHQALHAKRRKKYQEKHTDVPNETQDPETNKATRLTEPFCEECQKAFSCKFSLSRHISEYHKGRRRARTVNQVNIMKKRHTCDVCLKMFANIYSLRVHRGRVHPSKTHKCDICSKTYGVINDLKCHYKNHHIRLAYDCDICGKPFHSQSKLKEHYKIQHSKLEKERIARNKKHSRIAKSKMLHECDVCGKHFKFPSRLKEHLLVHKQPSSPNSDCPYQCEVCQKMFRYPSRLKEHFKFHTKKEQAVSFSAPQSEGQHQCSVCGKAFQYASYLKRHESIHCKQDKSLSGLNSEEQHPCDVCGDVFQNELHLKKHQTSHYQEESLDAGHPCNVCGKAFQFKSHQKRHETTHYKQKAKASRSTSSSDGPIECNVCDRKFQYPSQLREHVIIHNKGTPETKSALSLNSRPHSEGPLHKKQKLDSSTSTSEVPFYLPQQEPTSITEGYCECDVCGNTFKHDSYLRRHYIVHQQDSKDKSYLCIYCDRSFWQTNHLKQHCKKQHHTDKIFRCEACLVAFTRKVLLTDHQQICAKKDSSQNGVLAHTELKHVKQHVGKQTKSSKVSTGAEDTNNSASQYTEKNAGGSKKKHDTRTGRKGVSRPARKGAKRYKRKHFTLTSKEKAPTCNICGSTFCSSSALRTHLDIHLDRRPYSCRFCEMKFRQGGHLSVHCRVVHHDDFPYLCDLCKMPFKGALLLRKHQEIEHTVTENPNELDAFETSVVPRYSNVDFEPAKQYTRVANPKQTEYACGFCDSSSRTFKSLSGLRRHITVVHTTSGDNAHPQGSWNRRGVVTVPREVSPVNPAPPEEIYKCNVCSVIVHGWDALEAHEKAHAKRYVDSPSSTPPMLSTPSPLAINIKQIFECKYCGTEFDSMFREAFDQHQLEHELAAEEPMGMAYICVECDKEFAMPGDLIEHHEEAH